MSTGGVESVVAVSRLKLCFDIGRGDSRLVDIPRILLSHGHLDHSSGVAYHLSQRSLKRLPAGEVFVPEEIADPMSRIMELWSQIEGFDLDYRITPVDKNTYYPLQGDFVFKGHPTLHRIPSLAYTVYQRRIKLKDEFRDLPGPRIAELKQTGTDLFYEKMDPLITYSGDTRIDFFQENEDARNSRVLFLECTYIDDKRPVERARQWGHIHLDEIAASAELFRNIEKLYLFHFSARYRIEVIEKALKDKLPGWLYNKTEIFQ